MANKPTANLDTTIAPLAAPSITTQRKCERNRPWETHRGWPCRWLSSRLHGQLPCKECDCYHDIQVGTVASSYRLGICIVHIYIYIHVLHAYVHAYNVYIYIYNYNYMNIYVCSCPIMRASNTETHCAMHIHDNPNKHNLVGGNLVSGHVDV